MTIEYDGVFTDQDRGQMGALTCDAGMEKLSRAMETMQTVMPSLPSDLEFTERLHANEYLQRFVTRLEGVTLDISLPKEHKDDLDLRDDIRPQIRPSILRGLYAGQLIARSVTNG